MKKLTLLLTLGFLTIANAIYASSLGVASVNVYGSGAGTYVFVASGTGGCYQLRTNDGNCGTVDNLDDVEDIKTVVLVAVSGYGTFRSSCYLTVPAGYTASVVYNSSSSSSTVTIGSTKYQATNGTLTLSPGTYCLATSSSTSGNSSTASIQVLLTE